MNRIRAATTGSAGFLFASALFLAYATILFLHPQPARMNDFGDWNYEGVMLHQQMLGHALPHAVLKHYPVPNSLQTVVIALLCFVAPGEIAGKLWLTLFLVTALAVWRYTQRLLPGSNALSAVILPGIFVGLDFWYGLLSFLLGVLWITLLTTMLLRREPAEGHRPLAWAALLALAFFTHMIPCAVGVLLLLCFAWQEGRWKLALPALPVVVLTAWYAAGRYVLAGNADGQSGVVATARYLSPGFAAYKINSYLKSFDFLNPTLDSASLLQVHVGDAGFLLLFLLDIALALAIFGALCTSIRQSFQAQEKHLFVWIAGAVALPFILLLPGEALGISDPGTRVLQTVLWVSLWFITSRSKLMRFAAIAAATLTLVNLWQWSTVPFADPPPGTTTRSNLPNAVRMFGGVPYTAHYFYYDAIRRGDMSLPVWPTGMFRPRQAQEKGAR